MWYQLIAEPHLCLKRHVDRANEHTRWNKSSRVVSHQRTRKRLRWRRRLVRANGLQTEHRMSVCVCVCVALVWAVNGERRTCPDDTVAFCPSLRQHYGELWWWNICQQMMVMAMRRRGVERTVLPWKRERKNDHRAQNAPSEVVLLIRFTDNKGRGHFLIMLQCTLSLLLCKHHFFSDSVNFCLVYF